VAGKRITLDDVIGLLNKNVGRTLFVRDIAAILDTDEKTVRRHLRTIRERFPDKVKYYREYRKLAYEVLEPLEVEEVPTEEQGEVETVEVSEQESQEEEYTSSSVSEILEES
jgi:transposase